MRRCASARLAYSDGTRTGFECFVEDMGDRPNGFTIERRDYNGNYEPSNCEWISKSAQGKNCRGVRIIDIDGVSKTVPDWSAHFGVNYFTAHRRLKRGLEPKAAFSLPSGK